MESVRVSEKVEEIPGKEPSATAADFIGKDGFETVPFRHAVHEIGKVDPGENGQLERSPESGIDLHKLWDIIPWIHLELDHGHPEPVQSLEQR